MRNYSLRLHASVQGAVLALTRDAPAGEPRFERARARLAAHLARLNALRDGLLLASEHGRGSSEHARRLCDALREKHMIEIGRAGKRLMRFDSGAETVFTVPHKHATAVVILAAATRMLGVVKDPKRRRVFVEDGFPKGFVADFRLATTSLRRYISVPKGLSRRRSAEEREYEALLREARAEMRVVDAAVIRVAGTHRDFVASWRSLTKVRDRIGRPKQRKGRRPPPRNDGADHD